MSIEWGSIGFVLYQKNKSDQQILIQYLMYLFIYLKIPRCENCTDNYVQQVRSTIYSTYNTLIVSS